MVNWFCHCSGMDSIPGPELPHAMSSVAKKKKKRERETERGNGKRKVGLGNVLL